MMMMMMLDVANFCPLAVLYLALSVMTPTENLHIIANYFEVKRQFSSNI